MQHFAIHFWGTLTIILKQMQLLRKSWSTLSTTLIYRQMASFHWFKWTMCGSVKKASTALVVLKLSGALFFSKYASEALSRRALWWDAACVHTSCCGNCPEMNGNSFQVVAWVSMPNHGRINHFLLSRASQGSFSWDCQSEAITANNGEALWQNHSPYQEASKFCCLKDAGHCSK